MAAGDAACAQAVPADDRAFLYGDGLFESMLAVDGRIAFLDLHLDRLLSGARRLGIDVHGDAVTTALRDVPTEGAQALRLTVSRGGGRRGYLPEAAIEPRLRLAVSALERNWRAPPAPVSVILSSIVLADQPALAGMKHCNRLEQVLAAREAQQRGAAEAVMLNGAGAVQCAIAANIFCLRDGELLTPRCDGAGIAGTRRRLVLEHLAARAGLQAREATVTLADCRRAQAVLLTSALIGVRAVAQLDGQAFDASHAGIGALQNAYRAALDECFAA